MEEVRLKAVGFWFWGLLSKTVVKRKSRLGVSRFSQEALTLFSLLTPAPAWLSDKNIEGAQRNMCYSVYDSTQHGPRHHVLQCKTMLCAMRGWSHRRSLNLDEDDEAEIAFDTTCISLMTCTFEYTQDIVCSLPSKWCESIIVYDSQDAEDDTEHEYDDLSYTFEPEHLSDARRHYQQSFLSHTLRHDRFAATEVCLGSHPAWSYGIFI